MIIELPADATPKEKELLTKFTPMSERKPGESWILLYYGPSGSGKTWFCGTVGGRQLFINTGQGLETLLSPGFRNKHPETKDAIVIDIQEETYDAALAFDRITDAIDIALRRFPDKFDTICLDDATFMRRLALNKGMELNEEQRKVKRGVQITEFVKPEIGDYGVEMQMIEWFLGTYIPIFKEKGKHFVMTAHERNIYKAPERIGGEKVLVKTLPGFTGQTFPDQVPVYFDDVFHAEAVGGIGNTTYRARTQGNEMERGKARHNGIFNSVEVNPNFRKMLKKIQDSHSKG